MSIVSAGAKVLGKSIAALESEIEPGLRGVVKYMKRGGIIPSETKAGQLSFLPHGYGRRGPKPSTTQPPFNPTGKVSGATNAARDRVKLAARRQEREQQRLMREAADARSAYRGRAYAKVQNDLSEGYIDSPTAVSRNKDIAAADAAITQQDRMDVARKAGQMTGQEWKRQNRILMARRKRAGH